MKRVANIADDGHLGLHLNGRHIRSERSGDSLFITHVREERGKQITSATSIKVQKSIASHTEPKSKVTRRSLICLCVCVYGGSFCWNRVQMGTHTQVDVDSDDDDDIDRKKEERESWRRNRKERRGLYWLALSPFTSTTPRKVVDPTKLNQFVCAPTVAMWTNWPDRSSLGDSSSWFKSRLLRFNWPRPDVQTLIFQLFKCKHHGSIRTITISR